MTEDRWTLLAKKEEELRRLNEELTQKQRLIETESPRDSDKKSDENCSDKEENEYNYSNKEEPIRPDLEDENGIEEKDVKEEDAEFEKNLLEVKKYQEVVERCNEYERTIALQRAKIETLEVELQNSISNMNAKDLQISELESKDKSLSDQSKKYTVQINQLNVSLQRLKQQNEEYFKKIEGLEKTIAQQRQDLNKNCQAQAKTTQESHNKDLK